MLAAMAVLALVTACATTDPTTADTTTPSDAAPAGADPTPTETAAPPLDPTGPSASDGPGPGPSPEVSPTAPAEPTPTATPLVRPPFASSRLGFVPLDDPEVLSAAEATYLTDDAMVLGLESKGEARAYPLEMMWYHHITNDVLGGDPVLVTF